MTNEQASTVAHLKSGADFSNLREIDTRAEYTVQGVVLLHLVSKLDGLHSKAGLGYWLTDTVIAVQSDGDWTQIRLTSDFVYE